MTSSYSNDARWTRSCSTTVHLVKGIRIAQGSTSFLLFAKQHVARICVGFGKSGPILASFATHLASQSLPIHGAK